MKGKEEQNKMEHKELTAIKKWFKEDKEKKKQEEDEKEIEILEKAISDFSLDS
jgi:hypothetical protein